MITKKQRQRKANEIIAENNLAMIKEQQRHYKAMEKLIKDRIFIQTEVCPHTDIEYESNPAGESFNPGRCRFCRKDII